MTLCGSFPHKNFFKYELLASVLLMHSRFERHGILNKCAHPHFNHSFSHDAFKDVKLNVIISNFYFYYYVFLYIL